MRLTWVWVTAGFLAAATLACISPVADEDLQLRPTLILTPYATSTLTPAPTDTPPPSSTPTVTPVTNTYVVEPGDTLSGIAAMYGMSTAELMDLNDLDESDLLSVGQELRVPKR